jgi:hypothetical protein
MPLEAYKEVQPVHSPISLNFTLGPLSMISSKMTATSLSSTFGIFNFLPGVCTVATVDCGLVAGEGASLVVVAAFLWSTLLIRKQDRSWRIMFR